MSNTEVSRGHEHEDVLTLSQRRVRREQEKGMGVAAEPQILVGYKYNRCNKKKREINLPHNVQVRTERPHKKLQSNLVQDRE